jgi:hypothetical protein
MTREEPSLETLWLENIRTMDKVQITDRSTIETHLCIVAVAHAWAKVLSGLVVISLSTQFRVRFFTVVAKTRRETVAQQRQFRGLVSVL